MEKIMLIICCCLGPFILITTLVTISNLLTAPRLKKNLRTSKDRQTPFVSVCVPARNETQTLPLLLDSLLKQDYHKYEIIVLDDNSEDETPDIIQSYTEKYPVITGQKGKPLPPGWTGKNWACHQLSLKARGDILLFVDADCRVTPNTITNILTHIDKYSLALFSVFPSQIMHSWGEKLIVPLMDWLLLTILPLRLVYSSSWLSFVAANGQFMAFRRDAYEAIGGHNAIADNSVDDMALARNIKKHHYKMMTAVGNKNVSCKMYTSYKKARSGFCKNFYPGFAINLFLFILFIFFLLTAYMLPFILVFFHDLFLLLIAGIIVQRFIISTVSRQSILTNILLHIPQMFMMFYIGILSLYKSKKGLLIWKGRNL